MFNVALNMLFINTLNINSKGLGEGTQMLRTLAALAEDLSSIPASTTPVPGNQIPFLISEDTANSRATQTYMWARHPDIR